MPSPDLEELLPGSAGYICVICENPLINTVETSCRHKFCTYCISLWKKHHPLCPVCTRDIGPLHQRPDIDALIERFFDTADISMCQNREETIVKRKKASDLIRTNAEGGDEMKALMDILKPPPTAALDAMSSHSLSLSRTSSATSHGSNRNKDIARLLKETETFEQQLNTVYSKILTTGERLTAREDQVVARLCSAVVDNEGVSNFGQSNGRPCTVVLRPTTSKSSAFSGRLGTACPSRTDTSSTASAPKQKDQSEIDSLLELTDDVLRIDHFLKTFNFDTLTEGGDVEYAGDYVEQDGSVTILNDESLESTTLNLLGDLDKQQYPNFKVHPEVQKYLDKCPFKIKPHVPLSKKTKTAHASARPKTAIDSSQSSNSGSRPRPVNTTNSPAAGDLTAKILQCRESLLNLKEKSEQEQVPISFKPINYSATSGNNDETNQFDADESVVESDAPEPDRRNHTSGDGGSCIRPLTLTQRRPHVEPTKNDSPSASSLPAIVQRADKKQSLHMRPRPQTAIEAIKKPSYGLPRPR